MFVILHDKKLRIIEHINSLPLKRIEHEEIHGIHLKHLGFTHFQTRWHDKDFLQAKYPKGFPRKLLTANRFRYIVKDDIPINSEFVATQYYAERKQLIHLIKDKNPRSLHNYLSPIILTQFGKFYVVIDGHHRIAINKLMEQKTIKASINVAYDILEKKSKYK